jgi:hypothetical protein
MRPITGASLHQNQQVKLNERRRLISIVIREGHQQNARPYPEVTAACNAMRHAVHRREQQQATQDERQLFTNSVLKNTSQLE